MSAKLRHYVGALLPERFRRATRRRLDAISTARFHGRPGPGFQFRTFDESLEFLIDDVRLVLPQRFDSSQWLLSHPEDVLELQVFLRVAKQADGLMFDVGANIGMFAVLFCKVCRYDAIAFEPNPSASGIIQCISTLNEIRPTRIRLVQEAVGSEIGIRNMHLDDDTGFIQVQKYTSSRARSAASIRTPITTIDKIRSEIETKVAVLKIDVEGFEDEVLKGAQETLARDRPVISLELHSDYLRERGMSSRALVANLLEHGYP
jgi:FkbM family methyltransferase